ncbi:MAG: 50S ribosomal protein L6 [Candidatus Aenigmarchaeota archaeon]|nr:50S ribosomal protein L6 [Candidatus Aenigmarchaeota archaeon]
MKLEKKVVIPEKVEIKLEERRVIVKGPKGELSKDFDDPRFNKSVIIEKKDNEFKIGTESEKRKIKAFVGTIAAHVRKMITGVTVGFRYTMKIVFLHFPMSLTVKDSEFHIRNFLGEKGARIAKVVGKTEVKVDKDIITLTGINSEEVGQTAANIERACKLSKRDKRIFQDGIYLSGKFLQTGEEI